MKRMLMMAGVLAVAATMVQAAWTKPSAEQIKAAAKDPSMLTALLQGASDSEVASVIVDVLQEAATADPTQTLVNDIIAKAMQGKDQKSAAAIARAVGEKLGALAVSLPSVAAIGGMVQTAFGALPNAGRGLAAEYTAQYNQSVRQGAGSKTAVNLQLPPVPPAYLGKD